MVDPGPEHAVIDTIEAERFSALGDRPLCLIDLQSAGAVDRSVELSFRTQAVIVGLDAAGSLPAVDSAPFDTLLTTASDPPAPWVSVPLARWSDRIDGIAANVQGAPIAASVAMQLLRSTSSLPFEEVVRLESLAYSTLLGGEAFRLWRGEHPAAAPAPAPGSGHFVEMRRDDDAITILLANPSTRNAMCAGMRDALFNALAAALDDPTRPSVTLEGAGACFSTGGDLAEFGSATDLAAAHVVRTLRSCAALLHRLGDRASVVLHGACIGSGLEVPAAASRRVARAGAFFQLPELAMGLMPGAGGTATLPRAIGRHRTAYMLLSGRRIDAATALAWNLIRAIVP